MASLCETYREVRDRPWASWGLGHPQGPGLHRDTLLPSKIPFLALGKRLDLSISAAAPGSPHRPSLSPEVPTGCSEAAVTPPFSMAWPSLRPGGEANAVRLEIWLSWGAGFQGGRKGLPQLGREVRPL